MAEIKLLLVEDDNIFRQVTKESLELTGNYHVYDAKDGLDGYNAYKSYDPDIIVTDVDMPRMSGLDMIEKIRKEDAEIPVIIASGLTSGRDQADGFKLEIDNYIKKPYLPGELDHHIKAILRRIQKTKTYRLKEIKPFRLGEYSFDLKNHCLIFKNEKLELSPREAQILEVLYANKGEVVKRKKILEQFWGSDDYFPSRSLDVFISKLRKYLEKDSSVEIITIRGEGLKIIC